MSRFIQFHTLTSYPATLLNRDDAGFAKRIPFGGAVRTRISSQCQKKHWRSFDGEDGLAALGQPMSIRSRYTFDEYVVKPLVEQQKLDSALVVAATRAVMDAFLGKSAKAAKKQEKEEKAEAEAKGKSKAKQEGKEPAGAAERAALQTGQITVLGRAEVDYLRDLVQAVCAATSKPEGVAEALKQLLGKPGEKNLAAMRNAAGLDAALFGRMVTSDLLAQGDAAVHVAHAFTVHAEATESDYFSAVDQILEAREDEMGSGHIGTSELTTGLFYGYVAVDVPLLVSNLTGCRRADWKGADRTLAADVVERLVKVMATVSPGAKRGATAPYASAHMVLAEAGDAQPRTFANAFLKPVDPRPDLMRNAYGALGVHAADLDGMYGARFERCLSALGPKEQLAGTPGLERTVPLAELASWAAAKVRSA